MAPTACEEEAVRAALQLVLASKYFAQAEGLSNLLRYLVDETLAGRGQAIKELTVGCDVFGRGPSFDPKIDGIVRVQASRLRAKLREYYSAEGHNDDIVISVPAGAYVAEFLSNNGKPGGTDLGAQPPPSAKPPTRPLLLILAAVALISVPVIWLLTKAWQPSPVRIEAVTVLPFRNLTGDTAQDYLADALTDSLITSLGKLPGLRVTSRTTSMSLAGTKKSLKQIARDLQVDALVEGSMTLTAGNVRVNVNLLEVRERERHIYSQTLEHGLRDFAGLQDAMHRQVAAQIRPGIRTGPVKKAPHPDAYVAYLKGRHLAATGTEAGIRHGLEWYERAAALDPQLGLAKSGQAHAYIALSDFFMSPAVALPLAKINAAEAIRLDPYLAEAYVARGAAALFYDRDAQAAETDLRQALELNPNAPEAHTMFAVLCGAMGRFDEAVAAGRRGLKLDPLSSVPYSWLQFILLVAGRYEEVEEVGRAALQLFPDVPLINLWTASSLAFRGEDRKAEPYFQKAAKFDEIPMVPLWLGMMRAFRNDRPGALAQLGRAHKIGQRRYICPYEVASVHAALGEMDEAYGWMERGLGDKCVCLTWLMTEPWLKSFRADPRFPALAAKVGLWNKPRSF